MSPTTPYWLETEDWHTAGEPFRIVQSLPEGHLPIAESVAERRSIVLATKSHPLDVLRRTLCHEPRGHADMYGGFITPPNDSGAHFGVMFWHKDGFSTACGHGTIALGYWAVSNGIVPVSDKDGVTDVIIDVPSGRVTASVATKDGNPVHADFVNVLSYKLTEKMQLGIPSYGINADVQLSYAGAMYALVNASHFKLPVERNNYQEFIRLGREIKALIQAKVDEFPNQHELYGTIFFEEQSKESEDPKGVIRERNVTVFADGQVDRSPCGSGTCARLAIHFAEGRITEGSGKLENGSIVGTVFEGDIVPEEKKDDSIYAHGYTACRPRVRGKANLVGMMKFYIDAADPVYPGFLLTARSQ
jgi:trans-L-3-hydroxyproline dehydratase